MNRWLNKKKSLICYHCCHSLGKSIGIYDNGMAKKLGLECGHTAFPLIFFRISNEYLMSNIAVILVMRKLRIVKLEIPTRIYYPMKFDILTDACNIPHNSRPCLAVWWYCIRHKFSSSPHDRFDVDFQLLP